MLGIRELYTSLAVTAAILTASIFWLHFSRFSSRGILWWTCGMLCYTATLVLVTLRGVISPIFTAIIANTLATSGYVCLWFGIRTYLRLALPVKAWMYAIALTSLVFVVTTIATIFPEYTPLRISCICFSFVVLNILTARELLIYVPERYSAKLVAINNILNAIIVTLRLVHIINTSSYDSFFTTGWSTSAYILWTNVSLLLTTLGLILMIVEDLNGKLADQVMEDPLTGLYNRRAMHAITQEDFDMLKNRDGSIGILLLDIDHFKKVNDTYGHATGDALLTHFANEVSSCLRATDRIFRVGGEEFVILLRECNQDKLLQLADRIRTHIETHPLVTPKAQIPHTVSIGCASACNADTSLQHVIERADKALYSAKRQGRNKVDFFQPVLQ